MDSLTVVYFVAQLAHVPNLHGLIPAPGDQALAVAGERQAADETRVTAETADQRSGVAVPDAHGAPLAPRGEPPAVGAEGHRVDVPAVPAEGLRLLAGQHVPDLDRVVLTPRRESPAIRAESHVQTLSWDPRVEGAAGFLFLLQAGRVPQVHLPVAAR